MVDGDTFHAVISPGWGVKLYPRDTEDPGMGTVRIVFPDGRPYDAPETSTEHGRQARTVAQTIALPGERLEIVSFHLDAFGRTLAAVTLRTGQDWATYMTELGYVK